MGRARATITVPGRAVAAEGLWYDPARWASWIDGFGHVASLRRLAGARRAPAVGLPAAGPRPRVTRDRARPGLGQTVAVEDARLAGTQTVTSSAARGR